MIHAVGRFVLALTLLLGMGLIGVGTLQGCSTAAPGEAQPAAENSTAERRDAAVRAAEQTAVALVSLDHRDPEQGYDRLLTMLTGPARTQWEQRRAEYLAPLIATNTVSSEAAVRESGVAALESDATTVTVLVVATATVTSDANPGPDDRNYRLRMSLVPVSDGWKVSDLQIVE